MKPFKTRFLEQFFVCMHQRPANNWDHFRFPEDHPRHNQFLVDRASQFLDFILSHSSAFEETYRLLDDEESRELMVRLLVYRVLDHHHVQLPLNSPEYWQIWEAIDGAYLKQESVIQTERWALNAYFLPEFDVTLYGLAGSIMTMFLLKQYYYPGPPAIQPEEGDIVIDGGACWGDSALHFAHSVGERGQVHGFEFVSANLEIFQRNIDANPRLADRLYIAPYPMSDCSGKELFFDDRGPSTNLSQQGSKKVVTRSIDDYADELDLPRVDFIKMDIEGSEEDALIGARRVIAEHHPKLAISAYHKPDDLFQLVRTIREIDDGYRFHLGHYTIHNEETVLYAIHPQHGEGSAD